MVWVWLGGGGAVTQFLRGVPALLRKGGPCLGSKEPLWEGYRGREVRLRASCLAGVYSQGCGIWFQQRLRSTLLFSLLGAEKESVPHSLGIWRVSLWNSKARISFCLSVQLPSFRVF